MEIEPQPPDHTPLLHRQQAQVLKLVTESFCNELTTFGVEKSELVRISAHVLDYVTGGGRALAQPGAAGVTHADIIDTWRTERVLRCRNTAIRPLTPEQVPVISRWLRDEKLHQLMLGDLPAEPAALRRYLFGTDGTEFFGIFCDGELVGAIGGSRYDAAAAKLEMKKFIGEERYRGQGIGTKATLLWLHYAFEIRGVHKVYVFTLDGNIRNINLNARMGFELEGVLPQEVRLGGRYRDVVRMGLLQERWRGERAAGS